MPEKIDHRTVFTLFEFTSSIKRAIAASFTQSYWIKAEMNKLGYYPQSGNCFPELVEKRNGRTIAELRGIIWADDFRRINDTFLEQVGEPLKDGIKILLCATVSFEPEYGLKLKIHDIDPGYSLGELEVEKRKTIQRLREELVFDLNRNLPFPMLPKRIAVISVETSKGYADFNKTIDTNPWGYSFFHYLFPSLLQGERAVESIMQQLQRIRKVARHFDVVAIVRGGGGDVGLSCYNNYQLARQICDFPIPVLTGIGHATNETVTEMVAHRNAITPTDLANFLIQKFHNFSVPVQRAEQAVFDGVRRKIRESKVAVNTLSTQFLRTTKSAVGHNQRVLDNTASLLLRESKRYLVKRTTELDHMRQHLLALDPIEVLRRGYSVTMINGKAVRAVDDVSAGDRIDTLVSDGTISSRVEFTNKTVEDE